MPGIAAVPLAPTDLDAAADVLWRAFIDEPGPAFVLPDRTDRERLGPAWARAVVRLGVLCGAPLVTTDKVRGTAFWFRPGCGNPTDADLAESGMDSVQELLGQGAWHRYQSVNDHLDGLHPLYAAEPHWYLALLAVDPDWQRQGIGEALMQPVFETADRNGISCYLETLTERNVRFYERRGFETVGESDVPASPLHAWHMRREPKT